ncbi:unnamed protein product [Dicrocoelium dendriticum]|nr:unnamed protein product [Dicrocoelium dendriticum]
MPEAYPARVSSFTSEDKVYPASNLLKSSSFSKWQSEKGGTKQEAVELSFERPVEISRLDIGNNGSAFVEVLVRRSASSDEPTVFLPSSSFMSPVEAKNGTNLNRVRVFSGNQLLSTVSSQKWDTFRFVCTQPFNKNLQYGLSFVSFHSPAPASPSRQLSNLAKTTGLQTTNCILTEEEEEEDATAFQPGALFRASKTVVASDTVDTSLQKLVSGNLLTI